MQITIDNLQQKRTEYEKAYMEHMALANANHGAMEAIDALIVELNMPQEKIGEGEQPSP